MHKPGLVRDHKLPFHTSTGMPIALGGAHRKHTTKPQLLLAMHSRHPKKSKGNDCEIKQEILQRAGRTKVQGGEEFRSQRMSHHIAWEAWHVAHHFYPACE